MPKFKYSDPLKFESLPDSENITDPARVLWLLEQLAKQHSLLTVQIPGHQEHFTSSIVDIDRPHILLDELLPSTGHELLLAAGTLQVRGRLDGIDIRFITSVEGMDSRDDGVIYHANLPSQLEYRQRRHDYRAHIPLAQTLRVIIDNRDGAVIEGVLHDLSRGGAGILFPDVPPAVEAGVLYECAIELSDDTWLFCTIELCHEKDIPSRDQRQVGARFTELSLTQERLVGHCISKMEQELIRKRIAD